MADDPQPTAPPISGLTRSPDSADRLLRTYERTYEERVVTLREPGCEPNARESQTAAIPGSIKPVEWGRSLRFAEANGAKVITAVDLPESILTALAGLVDAVQREFGDATASRLATEPDEPKPLCRWHPGQLAEFCGPCRSELIAQDQP